MFSLMGLLHLDVACRRRRNGSEWQGWTSENYLSSVFLFSSRSAGVCLQVGQAVGQITPLPIHQWLNFKPQWLKHLPSCRLGHLLFPLIYCDTVKIQQDEGTVVWKRFVPCGSCVRSLFPSVDKSQDLKGRGLVKGLFLVPDWWYCFLISHTLHLSPL